jgi:hypothetical protein
MPHDPARERARLALAEAQCRLDDVVDELRAIGDGRAYPQMSTRRRSQLVENLRAQADHLAREVEQQGPLVGDPETVEAADGSLPEERRRRHLTAFVTTRAQQRRALEAELDGLGADRRERTAGIRHRLEALDRQPRDQDLLAAHLCPDGVHLMTDHGRSWTTPGERHPCPAWPGERETLARTWQIAARSLAERAAHDAAVALPDDVPTRLAGVDPDGLPIGEVVRQLAELAGRHPGAVVRRGEGTWELWSGVPPDARGAPSRP